MKKRIKELFIIFLLLITFSKVEALEVSKNNLTIEKGGHENVELYVNTESSITKVDFTLVFSTYDIPASLELASGLSDSNPNGIKHSITLPEPKSGKILLGTININVKNNAKDTDGSVSIHTATAKTEEGETINLKVQTINVKIRTKVEEPKKEIDKNLLDRIESELVDLELVKDVFEYTVLIKNSVEELDLNPVPKDSDTKVEISTQKIADLKDNIITITAKKDNTEQKYIIKVEKKEEKKKEEKVIIDEEEFKPDNSYKTKWIIMLIPLLIIFIGGIIITKKK